MTVSRSCHPQRCVINNIYIPKLMTRVVHVNYNPKLFIASRTLSSRLKVVYVFHNFEQFIAFEGLSS